MVESIVQNTQDTVIQSTEGSLGFVELWAIGIGQVIGAGVITLIGPAIGFTGKSVWLAYFIAVILGAITLLPLTIFSSVTKFSGGDYSIISMLGSEKLGGMYIVGFIMQTLSMSLFGTALGWYVNSMIPSIPGKPVGLTFIIIFYIINLLGIANMAKAQKAMSAILIVALMMLVVVGLGHADLAFAFGVTDADFFANGTKGFIGAVMLLIYSCQGYRLNVNYGGEAKDATKNIPKSILAVIPVIAVVYTGVALVASSVLPLDVVAGKPLTLVAEKILPRALFYVFMFGGPIMALLTTLNSSYSAYTLPFLRATKDGWFPEWLGKLNQRGSAWVILTLILMIGIIPIILNFTITTIVNNIMLITSVYNFLLMYSLYQMPKKMPEKWAKATMHMSNGTYYGVCTLALVVQGTIFFFSIKSLSLTVALVNILALFVCFLYAVLRHNSGATHIVNESIKLG
jgi:amino acid transporter